MYGWFGNQWDVHSTPRATRNGRMRRGYRRPRPDLIQTPRIVFGDRSIAAQRTPWTKARPYSSVGGLPVVPGRLPRRDRPALCFSSTARTLGSFGRVNARAASLIFARPYRGFRARASNGFRFLLIVLPSLPEEPKMQVSEDQTGQDGQQCLHHSRSCASMWRARCAGARPGALVGAYRGSRPDITPGSLPHAPVGVAVADASGHEVGDQFRHRPLVLASGIAAPFRCVFNAIGLLVAPASSRDLLEVGRGRATLGPAGPTGPPQRTKLMMTFRSERGMPHLRGAGRAIPAAGGDTRNGCATTASPPTSPPAWRFRLASLGLPARKTLE